jgi:hypothetical protein
VTGRNHGEEREKKQQHHPIYESVTIRKHLRDQLTGRRRESVPIRNPIEQGKKREKREEGIGGETREEKGVVLKREREATGLEYLLFYLNPEVTPTLQGKWEESNGQMSFDEKETVRSRRVGGTGVRITRDGEKGRRCFLVGRTQESTPEDR